MSELIIDCSGDVRLNYETIGTIRWDRPTAHYDAAGEWSNEADLCHCCVGEEEWDDLNYDLDHERRQNARLRAQLAEVRAMLGVRR